MFKRVIYDGWTYAVPIFAFVVMFSVFCVTTIRAIRMSRKERNHLSHLPLENQNNESKL
jgi:hypothetical protein